MFTYILFLTIYPFLTYASTGYDSIFIDGQDRCVLRDCLCEVRPSPVYTSSRNVEISRRLSIYFEEDSWNISDNDRDKIINFFNYYGNTRYSIIGYTDGCGSTQYNSVLARNRAREISRYKPSGASSTIISGGEISSGHSREARRVDIIVKSRRRLTNEIERIPADFYLIDASGSMWNSHARWSDVVSASLKPNSRIFLSMVSGCRYGQPIGSVLPSGGTEIWYSYWKILDKMSPGQTLLIVSDFRSTVPLTSREYNMIANKARERGVRVITVRP